MYNQYKSIFKATTLFGGTQVCQILFNLLRSKSIALLIGATGMGITTMYNSSLTLIITLFGMGINISVVNHLTKAYDKGDEENISLITTVFRRLLLILSLLGMIAVIAFSPLLSLWSFGDNSETLNYCLLSVLVVMTLLQQGNTAILVSMKHVKYTAMSSVLSSLATLLVSVPFFYFMRYEGIVPGMIFSSVCSYIISLYFVSKIKIKKTTVSMHTVVKYSKIFISLGMAMVLSQLFGSLSLYVINISVKSLGGLVDLGFYNSAVYIVTYSVMLVFSSMASDYYPRLLSSLKDRMFMNSVINQQTEIIILLAVPILSAMIFFTPLVVRIILSSEFLVIIPLLRILCIGMFLKSISYALGYVSLAHGEKNVYFCIEGIYSNLATVILSVFFYWMYGLEGLGYAMVVDFLLYFFVIYIVDKYRYGYIIDRRVIMLVITSVLFLSAMFSMSFLLTEQCFYVSGGFFLVVISALYLYTLKKRVSTKKETA